MVEQEFKHSPIRIRHYFSRPTLISKNSHLLFSKLEPPGKKKKELGTILLGQKTHSIGVYTQQKEVKFPDSKVCQEMV